MKQDDRHLFIEASRKRLQTMKVEVIGLSSIAALFPNRPSRLKPYGLSSASKNLTALYSSIKPAFARTAVCSNGATVIGRLTPPCVVNMLTVRLLLAIAKIHKLDSKAIDFVLALDSTVAASSLFASELTSLVWRAPSAAGCRGRDFDRE